MNYYEYFDTPSSGECLEYELLLANKQDQNERDFEFGFCSGESPVLSFYVKESKLYDNDLNFVHHFSGEEFEIYGNVFHDYHNYSIDRVPVNLNCSKVNQLNSANYIDGIYYSSTGVSITIKAYGEDPPPRSIADSVYLS